MRSRWPVAAAGVAVLTGLLAGCSGDPEPATGPGLPSQSQLEAYFAAITSGDVDAMVRVGSDLAAEGSAAQGYAAYVAEFTTSLTAAGEPPDAADVEAVDGGFKACVGDTDQCATWTDLEGADGKLADFSINDKPMSSLLVDLTGQQPVVSDGLYEVQPDWAYHQPSSGNLLVVCTVTASDVPLTPKPGVYIEGKDIIDGDASPGLATVEAGTSSPVVLSFPGATDIALDGAITFDLEVGDESTESIGFGLTTPAP